MPKRPSAHVVGDAGVSAVRAALPKSWIVREQTHDYGIDLEIEIPDAKNELTGIIAKGQVKAFNSTYDSRASIRIDCDALSYWCNFPVPVFVFLVFRDGVFVFNALEHVQDNLFQKRLLAQKTIAVKTDQATPLPASSAKIERDAQLFCEWSRQGLATLHFAIGARYVLSQISASIYNADIDLLIDFIRYFGGIDQVRNDLPYLCWLKEYIEKRGISYKNYLIEEFGSASLVFGENIEVVGAIRKARVELAQLRAIFAPKAGDDRKDT